MTEFDKADLDKNGKIDQSEWDKLAWEDRRREMYDADHKRDAQLKMTWFALSGMVLYPVIILICSIIGFDAAATLITEIASIYIISSCSLCAAYFGFSQMAGKKPTENKQ